MVEKDLLEQLSSLLVMTKIINSNFIIVNQVEITLDGRPMLLVTFF